MIDPSKMTDDQLNEALAKVMGWHKGEIYDCFHEVWLDCDNLFQYAITCGCILTSLDLIDHFDPLHDHNHMALPRKKMRDNGWHFLRSDLYDGRYRAMLSKNIRLASVVSKDELRAEGEAIVRAARGTDVQTPK